MGVGLVVEVEGMRLSGLDGGTLRGKGDGRAGEEAKEGGAEAKKWSMRVLCFWAGLGGDAAEVVVNVVEMVVVVVVVVWVVVAVLKVAAVVEIVGEEVEVVIMVVLEVGALSAGLEKVDGEDKVRKNEVR